VKERRNTVMQPSTYITDDEARHVLAYLMRRAVSDPSFRRSLLTEPRTALEREFDIDLPADLDIRFVENLGADMTVVLPDPQEDRVLTDDDLEHVAGGTGYRFVELLLDAVERRYRPHGPVLQGASESSP
jgi:hypothetical protein